MKYLLISAIALFCAAYASGQYTEEQLTKLISTSSEEQLVPESSQMLQEGYYVQAEKIVDALLAKQPANHNYNYRKGFILTEGRGNYAAAIPYLEKAVSNVKKNYDIFSPKETSAPIEALFQLGRCYHREGELTKAKEYYDRFLAQASSKTNMARLAQLGLQQLATAQNLQEYPKKNVRVVNLGELINTPYPDYSPLVSFDGSALYYTSRRPWPEGQSVDFIDPRYDLYPEDIYVAYRDFDGGWVQPSRLEFCQPDQNEASISVSVDERRIYVYEDIVGNGDIFYSDFSTNRFNTIEALNNKDVNTNGWETHCYVTPDGRNMYFTSDRKGGYGGRDIYRIVKLPDGSWSKPFNLGPKINTEFDEEAPFVSIDNRTLYFASNGPKSMGGFDIMVSIIDNTNDWSEAINLGYPMNSTGDDLFYTETVDGRRGYITSMRGDSYGEKDIYEIQNDYLTPSRLTILKGKIITTDNRPVPEDVTITVTCLDCDPSVERTVYPRIRDGIFMINLEPCHAYDVTIHHEDGKKEIFREPITTACDQEYQEIYREVYLNINDMTIVPKKDTVPATDPVAITDPEPVVQFEPLHFKHHFAYNVANASVYENELHLFVQNVEKQLKQGKNTVTINIYASASKVPTKTYRTNQALTDTRAKNMKDKLDRYFAQDYRKRVQVNIVSAVVAGPAYQGDNENEEKYQQWQFVELKTE